METYQISKLKK